MDLKKNLLKRKEIIKKEKIMKEMIANYLFNDEMKDKVVKELNDNINIPIINEKTEGKIIEAIYETVEACVKKAIMK